MHGESFLPWSLILDPLPTPSPFSTFLDLVLLRRFSNDIRIYATGNLACECGISSPLALVT